MYKTASRKYASAVRIAKAKSWKGFKESHTALNARGMPYKILSGKTKTKSVLSTLEVTPYEFTAGTRDTTEFLVSSQLPDDKLDEDTPLQANIRERASLVAPEPADFNPITPGDVQYYIDTVKRHKVLALTEFFRTSTIRCRRKFPHILPAFTRSASRLVSSQHPGKERDW